jgi:glutamate/tyrosine decarboxylase-like PLP-dependent enzyme
MHTIPAEPLARDLILREMEAMRGDDVDWRRGRCFSLVYHADDAHAELVKRAHNAFFSENALNPMAFRSLQKMEREVVEMAASLFHATDGACGTMTSGGTESLLLAVKTARDWARVHRPWITKPEIVMPATAHVAFDKAAHYFGVRIRRARVLGDHDPRVDVRHVAKLVTRRRTILVVASAPQYPHGVVDDVAAVAKIAKQAGALCHVDACVGGFLLPFLERSGARISPWDFRVDGVTTISADLHKFGYAAKGASVIVHRSRETLSHQMFVATEFPGGLYASPTIAGTRPGGPIAAAWATLRSVGMSGYDALARRAWDASERLRAGVRSIDALAIIGDRGAGRAESTLFAWRSIDKHVDTFAIADALERRGWHVDRQHKPTCVHLTVTANHDAIVDEYLADLRACVDEVRAHPELKRKGQAAMYGAVAKLPSSMFVRPLVERAMKKVMLDVMISGGAQR